MDPTSTLKPILPPACRECTDAQAEIWEPPFERWQRLTETLIADADRASDCLDPTHRIPPA
jgi:hypothetical protein